MENTEQFPHFVHSTKNKYDTSISLRSWAKVCKFKPGDEVGIVYLLSSDVATFDLNINSKLTVVKSDVRYDGSVAYYCDRYATEILYGGVNRAYQLVMLEDQLRPHKDLIEQLEQSEDELT